MDYHFTILYCSCANPKLFWEVSCINSSAFSVVAVRIVLELKKLALIYLILMIGCLLDTTKKLQ